VICEYKSPFFVLIFGISAIVLAPIIDSILNENIQRFLMFMLLGADDII